MTKRFALTDTLPAPYFTVDAGAEAALAVRVAPYEKKGEPRMSVEIWRDNTIFCRVFAKSVKAVEGMETPALAETFVAPIPKEQLRSLLNHFLDELAASNPSVSSNAGNARGLKKKQTDV